MVASGKNTMELIIAARDRTGGAFSKVTSRMGKLGGASKKVTAALKGAAKAGALIGGAAVVAGIVGSTKAFMDFEDAMANVRKTTGLSKEKIELMGEAINALALKIPVAQTELAAIAATAGQLGISGQKNILSFTETVAKMTTAFDMSAESVAIAMAKLTKIYDIPIEQVGNLGSAINVLGNTTAASESQLMAFSMALGPTGQQLGFTATEALSLGASMVSIGMDASNAGTRLSRAFSMIGHNLDELADFMGVSTAEFTKSFEEMPMETFMGVLEKLSQVEGKLKANTIASNLFNEIGAKAIKGLTGDLEGLKTNLKSSAEGFEANTSLTEEFAAKTDTLKARFQLLKNSISGLLIDIGGELAPTLNQLIEGFRNIIPPLKDLIFEIGSGFSEMFESITRQAGDALDPLIEKVKEAGDKISSGLNFRTLLDDIGVFIGVALNPLIRGFTWLIDKLGPLWDLIGKGATLFHNLANALKTEEGRLDDILDATEKVTKAKQDLFDINEKLRGNVETLADALEKAGAWTTVLADLEADAKTKTDALTVARETASEAIAVHGANSEIAKTAIENVKIAEEAATIATNDFNTAVSTAAGVIIDEGVATEGLEKAQLELIASTETAATTQGELKIAVSELERELEEANAAPLKLGEAFKDFGKVVASVFLAIPLKVAEAILSVQEIVSGGLEKIGLGGFAEKLDVDTAHIKEKIASIRESLRTDIEEPLLDDIPNASEKMKDAVTDAADAIVRSASRVKEGVEGVDVALKDAGKTATKTGEAGKDAFEQVKISVDEVTGEVETLTDNLGDTAATLTKNEKAAKALLNLDWKVFSDLQADLPNINSGIDSMTDAFTGLESVLVENIEKMDKIKVSIENISELSTPFTEEGFMDGIKSISLFAETLKEAGSAINTFANLQDVSIDGCLRFSGHVHDMVSALRILENQMEDLVPAFGNMDSIIGDITTGFLSGIDITTLYGNEWEALNKQLHMVSSDITFTNKALAAQYGLTVAEITSLREEGDLAAYAFMAQTNALSQQTGQLERITNALKPYLSFMSTLNELAALSALSTEELNKGLNSIQYTFTNLGSALAKFDLQATMESLFGSGEAEGSAKKFMDTMSAFESKFFMLTDYVDRLSGSLMLLVNAFSALEEVNKSVLSDQVKLEAVFKGMVDVMANFSKAMDESGFGEALAKGMDAMLESAEPLILYFRDNGAAVTEFNNTFSAFGTTLKNIIEISEDLAKTVRTAGDETVVSSEEIAKAMEKIPEQLGQIAVFLETDIWKLVVEGLHLADNAFSEFEDTIADTDFSIIVTTFRDLLDVMDGLKKVFSETEEQIVISSTQMEKAMEKIPEQLGQIAVFLETDIWELLVSGLRLADNAYSEFEDTIADTDFGAIIGTFRDLLNIMDDLKTTFVDLDDQIIISSAEMVHAMEKIPEQLGEITKFLDTNIWKLVADGLTLTNNAFAEFEKSLDESTPGVTNAIETFSSLVNMVTSLTDAFESVKDMSVITSRDMEKAMGDINVFIIRFTEALRLNMDALVDALIDLDIEWAHHAKTMEKTMPSFESASGDITTLISSFSSLANAMESLAETGTITSTEFDTGFGALINSINNFAASLKINVGPMISTLESLRDVWMENEAVLVPLMQDFVTITRNFTSMATNANIMTEAFKSLSENSSSLEAGFKTLISFIKEVVANVEEFYTPETAAEIATFVVDIEKVIDSFSDLNSKIASAVRDIENKISDAVNDIQNTLLSIQNINSTMYYAGANLMASLINGIYSMQAALAAALADTADLIEAYLGVESPTELGALRSLDEWPRNLVQSFSKGITAEMSGLNASFAGMVTPAAVIGGGGSGNRTSVVFYVTQNIKDKTTADYSNMELEKLLKRHTV